MHSPYLAGWTFILHVLGAACNAMLSEADEKSEPGEEAWSKNEHQCCMAPALCLALAYLISDDWTPQDGPLLWGS